MVSKKPIFSAALPTSHTKNMEPQEENKDTIDDALAEYAGNNSNATTKISGYMAPVDRPMQNRKIIHPSGDWTRSARARKTVPTLLPRKIIRLAEIICEK